MHMNIVKDVLGALKIVAVDPMPMEELAELGPFRERRRRALAQISENQADRLSCRIGCDLHLVAEGLRLGGLRGALTCRVECPTVVSTGELLSLYPAGRQLCAAMRAPMHGDVWAAALASIERKIFTQDPDGDRLSLREMPRQKNRLPETAEVAPGDRRRSGMDKVDFLRVYPGRVHYCVYCLRKVSMGDTETPEQGVHEPYRFDRQEFQIYEQR